MSFKVGDVCVGQNFYRDVESNGMECVVLSFVPSTTQHHWITGEHIRTLKNGYEVRWADGFVTVQSSHELRLKRPPSKDDSEPRTDFTPSISDDWTHIGWAPKQKERV